MGHGCKGIFVTSDRNKEGLAVKEIYRLLEEVSVSKESSNIVLWDH